MKLCFVETHSGRSSFSPEGQVPSHVMSSMVPHYIDMLDGKEPKVPGYPEYSINGTANGELLNGENLLACIFHRGFSALTFCVVTSRDSSQALWKDLHNIDYQLATKDSAAPRVPWCATRIEDVRSVSAMSSWAGDYVIIAAWAWIERCRRNKTVRRKNRLH